MSNGTPPIQPAPVPPSIAGIPQPVFGSGSATVPATPIPITGTPILPPPLISNPPGVPAFPPTGGSAAPVPVPVGPLVGPAVGPAPAPPSVPGVVQPQYQTGSGTVPTAASLFPAFTSGSPSPPIVVPNTFRIGAIPPPLPSTPPATNLIVISPVPTIPQMPWDPPSTRPPIPLEPPINVNPPTLTFTTGGPTVGNTCINGTPGTWNPAASSGYQRQWQSAGVNIPGAIGTTYILQASDVGNLVRIGVTGINPDGQATAYSATVGPVTEPAGEEPVQGEEPVARTARATPKRTTRRKR